MKHKVLLLVIIGMLTGCRSKQDIELDYSTNVDYEFLKEVQLDNYQSLFNFNKDVLVYIYSKNCHYCNSIKNQMINYVNNHQSFYVLEYSSDIPIKNVDYELIGVDNLNDFFIYGYPTLLEIANNTIVSYYLGVSEIITFLNLEN